MDDGHVVESRKARRKRERAQVKEQRRRRRAIKQPSTTTTTSTNAINDDDNKIRRPPPQKQAPSSSSSVSTSKKRKYSGINNVSSAASGKKSKKESKTTRKKAAVDNNSDDPYAGLSPDVAAALRAEDAEIAHLEAKLGLVSSSSSSSGGGQKEKKRLNKEYAKLEGYGDDFGDFLDDLDKIIVGGGGGGGGGVGGRRSNNRKGGGRSAGGDAYDSEEGSDPLAALNEDYDSIDEDGGNHGGVMERYSNEHSSESDEEDDEEEIPMNDVPIADDDDSVMEELERAEEELRQRRKEKHTTDPGDNEEGENSNDEGSSDGEADDGVEDDENDSDENEDNEAEADHNTTDTYQPTRGQDIYGNVIDASASSSQKPSAYVPPHLRNKQKSVSQEDTAGTNIDQARQESLRTIQRSLNNALNRLSQDTLVPVTHSIAQLYDSNATSSSTKKSKKTSHDTIDCHHATRDVNEGIWNHTRNACVTGRAIVMTGLIPVYMAALAGVVHLHPQAQLAEHLLEMNVTSLWKILDSERESSQTKPTTTDDAPSSSKEACNLCLILCYLYNFGMVHCSLLYDVIRNLIGSFKEIDVELLLLILSHCGRALRSDDPLALKEIVLLVVQKQVDAASSRDKHDYSSYSSRVDYMVSAMNDLKNNKRRKQDTAITETTLKLRKAVGHIKSNAAARGSGSSSGDSSLRITLDDIFNADTKGRWWKVGASWIGNQYQYQFDDQGSSSHQQQHKATKSDKVATTDNDSMQDKTLLKLAAKYRMNTDIRRSIFCIIMGSADCDDAFEKLVRGGMLKNRTERDTVRVLMECCANEKAFNKFYAHLANRICEYQVQCKFTFQLAYWDIFKQFEEDDSRSGRAREKAARKTANMAKLLFHLVVQHGALKLNIFKAIDMASHEELPETALIFLTIFFTNLMEYYDDPTVVAQLFQTAITNAQQGKRKAIAEDDDLDHFADESEALRGSFSLFFVQVLKSSPKYKKGSKFRANLKAAIKACDSDNFFE